MPFAANCRAVRHVRVPVYYRQQLVLSHANLSINLLPMPFSSLARRFSFCYLAREAHEASREAKTPVAGSGVGSMAGMPGGLVRGVEAWQPIHQWARVAYRITN